ncbi:DUF4134 family protein [Mucilaginibacter sabulilitoris]|uniref:DUF4134 family protein n=1 Tax=Mucilaginibacter sabulilitoris TaxID=1173583 RepID=A0ABZ0TVD9_9SPHI|nr:DUF4134 family protein [Mucilaginibacter sabulilitoris]WPU95764.1 DUF4134 family protein [Mucilaginibacter sabulilitoris]
MDRPVLRFLGIFFLLMISFSGFAQPGINEFNQVRTTVRQWYFGLSDLAAIMGAISGMIGGLRVYVCWQTGRHHIDAQVMGWLFACIFLSIISVVLRTLFGI